MDSKENIPRKMPASNFTITHTKLSPKQSSDEIRLFARTLDCLLSTCVKYPQLLELYLLNENPTLLCISLETVKQTSWTERINFLANLLSKYSINNDEISILCFICVCRFELSWLPEPQQNKIKELQNAAIKKVENEKLERNRLSYLINLSGHCLNIFKSLILC